MDIQVVLTENDPKLGKRGQVLKVSSGYAHNFLLPNKKALIATPANLKSFEEQKVREAKDEAACLAAAGETAKKISAVSLKIGVLAGEGDKLYGAVTSQDILQALAAQGITVDKKDLHLPEPIKKLGEHQIPLKLHKQVTAQLKLSVVKKS